MNRYLAALLLLNFIMVVQPAAGDTVMLSPPERSLVEAMHALHQDGTEQVGLQTDCRIIISEQERHHLRYLFTLSLGTGGRFRCDVTQSPNGPLTIAAPGDGSLWIHLPQDNLVLLTGIEQLRAAASSGAASIEDWVVGLRGEVRLELARSSVSEAIVFLPRRPEVAELEDIKRVVLWLQRQTGYPRRLLVYDREHRIKVRAETASSWSRSPLFTDDFFLPPADETTRQIDFQAFFAALSSEERIIGHEQR